jgi:hypothetical protein
VGVKEGVKVSVGVGVFEAVGVAVADGWEMALQAEMLAAPSRMQSRSSVRRGFMGLASLDLFRVLMPINYTRIVIILGSLARFALPLNSSDPRPILSDALICQADRYKLV